MKLRIHIVCLIVFSLSIPQTIFSQSPGKWGPWETSTCYQGISFSVLNMGFSKNAGGYLWGIRFKNNYPAPLQFKYKMTIGEESKTKQGYWQIKKIKPGEVWTEGKDAQSAKMYNSSSGEYFVYFDYVCFGDINCWEDGKCYAECDEESGKPNQPCGFASADKKTANIKSEEEDTLYLKEGKWQSDDKKHNVILEYNEEGLFWRDKDLEKPAIINKIGKGVFGFETNDGTFLQYVESRRLAYKENGKVKYYFNWKSALDDKDRMANEQKSEPVINETKVKTEELKPISLDGEWKCDGCGDNPFSSDYIAMTTDGFNLTLKGIAGVFSFKKLSPILYVSETQQNNFAIIKLVGSNRYKRMSYFYGNDSTYYNRVNPVEDFQIESPDYNLISLDGEWQRNDLVQDISLTMTGDGFNWLTKGTTNLFSFKKTGTGIYRTVYSGNNYVDVKLMSQNIFTYWDNDKLKYYYTRKNPIPENNEIKTSSDASSSIETDAKKLAGYNCRVFKLTDKTDPQSKKELEELSNKANAFTLEIEKKYTNEKDKNLFLSVFNKEMNKCQ